MDAEEVVSLRLQGDSGSLNTASKEARDDITSIGVAAKEASATATAALGRTEAEVVALGNTAEATANKIGASFDRSGASMSAFAAEAAVIKDFMSTEAQSLDDVVERRAAYNEALASGILYEKEYKSAIADLEKQEASITAQSDRYVASVGKIADKYSGASGAAALLTADEDKLNAALKDGTLSADKHALAMEGIAAKRAVLAEETAVVNGMAGAMEHLSLESQGAQREIGVMVGETVRGNFARLEGSAVTLANRTGLLGLAFSTVGAAVLGVIGIVAGAGVAYVQHEHEIDSFNTALIATAGYAGTSGTALLHLADDLGASTGEYGNAEKAVLGLANSGRVLSSNLSTVAAGAVNLSTITGQSIEKSVADFDKLGDEPVKGSLKLNEQLHYLTIATLDQIAAQERAGDTDGAAATAQKALATAVAQRAQEVEQSLSGLTRYWHDLEGGAHAAWQAMLNIGDDSVGGQIDDVLKKIEAQKNALANDERIGEGNSSDAQNRKVLIAQLEAEYAVLNKTSQAARAKADAINVANDADRKANDAAIKTVSVFSDLATSMQKRAVSTGQSNVAQVQATIEERVAAEAALDHSKSIDDLRAKITQEAAAALDNAQVADQQAAAHKSAAAAARELAEAQREAAQDGIQLDDMISKLSESTDPLAKVTADYNTQLDFLGKTEAAYATAGLETVGVLDKLQLAEDLVNKRRDESVAKINAERDLFYQEGTALDQLFEKYREQESALDGVGAAHEREQREAEAARDAEKAWADSVKQAYAAGDADLAEWIKSQHDGFIQSAKDHADYQQTLKDEQAVIHDWANTAEQDMSSAFTSINKDIIEGGSVMKDLGNLWKQVVEQMLLEIEKLAIIGPIMNAVFGTNMPTLGTAGGALGMLLGNSGSADGSGGGMSSLGSLGGIGNLFSGVKSLYSGASGWLNGAASSYLGWGADEGLMTSGVGAIGSADELGLVPDYANLGSEFGEAGADAFADSAGTYGTEIGSEAGASFLGTVGPMLGAAALGYKVGGVTGAVGLAAAAYFVPVIGWIAGAISLVDTLTGGELLGTDWKPTGNTEEDFNVGASGATVTASAEEKKHKALFSGSEWRTLDIPVDQQQQDAASKFYDGLQKAIEAGAQALGEDVPALITGSFKETFDKKGNITSQMSTVMGDSYSETLQQFQERITGENLLALLPAATGAQEIAAKWRSSADDLLAGAEFLDQAYSDNQKGMGLLGSADSSLADIDATVESLQQTNETLVQTYARLQGETQDITANLDELGLSTGKTGADFVTFADQLVQVAGGLDNLNQKFGAYYSAYYTPEEQQSNAMNSAKDSVGQALSGIGESATVTMAQFRKDFEAAMPNLTPEQLNQWLDAAAALAAYTHAVATSAQQYASNEIALYGDDFVSAVANAVAWEQQQIDTANQLAQAAGLAGASQQDLSEIMTQGSASIGKAFAQLISGIDSDITSLGYGSSDDSYTQFGLSMGGHDPNVSAAHAQELSTGYDLIQKLGSYAFGSGETIEQALKDFGLSEAQIARTLGVDPSKVDDQLNAAKDSAASLTKLATTSQTEVELLQNISDELQGKPPTFDITTIAATTDPVTGPITKPGIGTGTLPSQPSSHTDVATAFNASTASVTDAITSSSNTQTQALRNLLLRRGVGNRNTRSTAPYRAGTPA